MSSTTTQKREQIRLEAQQLREAESSRHEISKLAHELLLERLDERHAENERISLEERVRVDLEYSANDAKLVVAHKQESSDFEGAGFAMMTDFDAQRAELWTLLAEKEEEAGRQHTKLLQSLQDKLALDDQAAEQELQKTIEQYMRKQRAQCGHCSEWSQWHQGRTNTTCYGCGSGLVYVERAEVVQARAQAARSTAERHKVHGELVDRHQAEWKLGQEALRLGLNHPSRQARLDLEHDFLRQFAEHDQRHKMTQLRHAEERKDLANTRDLALGVAQVDYERAQAELREKRGRVNSWWNRLCEKSAAILQRIDEDEKHALIDFDLQDAAVAMKAESEGQAVEAEAACSVTPGHLEEEEERVEGVKTAEVHVENEEHATGTRHASDEEGIIASALRRRAHSPLQLVAQKTRPARYPTMPLTGDKHGAQTCQQMYLNSQWSHPLGLRKPLAMTSPFDTQFSLTVHPAATPATVCRLNVTGSTSYVDPVGSVPDRSCSPDSGGSELDFLEI